MPLPTIKYEDLTPEMIKAFKIEMWGDEDDEELSHSEIEDSIESQLDLIPYPEALVVCGYRRLAIRPQDLRPDTILEEILERLDEQYGGVNRDPTDPSSAMELAAGRLVDVIKNDYQVWACEGVLNVELTDVMGWVKKNRPDWLEEDEEEADPRRFQKEVFLRDMQRIGVGVAESEKDDA